MKDEVDKWLVCKGYNHIDLPFSGKQRAWIDSYVRNSKKVAQHAFLPLMHRVMRTYPFKIDGDGKRKCNPKTRNLYFASHLDAAIYSYYAHMLQEKYEMVLSEKKIDDVVTAYRKIKCDNRFGNKCNIDFANEIFAYVREHVGKENPLTVITFDIKGFFDNLDHQLLKRKLKDVLAVKELSKDWYQIFKHITKYSWVEEAQIFQLFRKRIKCRTNSGLITERKVSKKYYLRDKNAIAFCEKKDLRLIRSKKLIQTKKKSAEKSLENIGIPQGLPISATLANVYMIDFDVEVKKLLAMVGGIYRRYSDDIIVVCPNCVGELMEDKIRSMITNVKLSIEVHKTNRYLFEMGKDKILCSHSVCGSRRILTYLGFSFDGNRILLKNSSVSKFYYKMHQSILRSMFLASHINNKTRGIIFEHVLISRYTGAGAKVHKVYRRKKNGKFILSNKRSYGNYLTYVYKSADIMKSAEIRKQVRKSTNILSKEIMKAKIAVQKYLCK